MRLANMTAAVMLAVVVITHCRNGDLVSGPAADDVMAGLGRSVASRVKYVRI